MEFKTINDLPAPKSELLTVGQYLELLKGMLEPLRFLIQGEITTFNARGGTIFFTIADKTDGVSLECIIWKNIYDALGIEIEDGMEVKIYGNPSIYKKNGKLSFMASYIIPIGEGALQKAYENLKKKLETLGYFKHERKRAIPDLVTDIGLITASGSDAKKDFETHAGKFGYKIYFYDVRVEGEKAIDNIIQAIKWFNEYPNKIDVLVVTRGGGSLESLQAFNSEGVARAIFSSKTPIISGVGHENDVTIADLVADLRASTPTHAGRIIAESWQSALRKIELSNQNITENFNKTMLYYSENINKKVNSINSSFENTILHIKSEIKNKELYLKTCINRVLETYQKIRNTLLNSVHKFDMRLLNYNNKITSSEKILKLSDPTNRLKQGFSITRDSFGKIIKDSHLVKSGDILITAVAKGLITSIAERTKNDN